MNKIIMNRKSFPILHHLVVEQDVENITSVNVMSSLLDPSSAPLSSFINGDMQNVYTANKRGSFISLKLNRMSVKLTFYTLRNGSWGFDMLRNWNLEGSSDGVTWNVIKKHKNDESFCESLQICGWNIDCNHFYSYFRIIVTGKNSIRDWNLSCSGIELYGHLQS